MAWVHRGRWSKAEKWHSYHRLAQRPGQQGMSAHCAIDMISSPLSQQQWAVPSPGWGHLVWCWSLISQVSASSQYSSRYTAEDEPSAPFLPLPPLSDPKLHTHSVFRPPQKWEKSSRRPGTIQSCCLYLTPTFLSLKAECISSFPCVYASFSWKCILLCNCSHFA